MVAQATVILGPTPREQVVAEAEPAETMPGTAVAPPLAPAVMEGAGQATDAGARATIAATAADAVADEADVLTAETPGDAISGPATGAVAADGRESDRPTGEAPSDRVATAPSSEPMPAEATVEIALADPS